jgi:hypothetical protein
MKRNRISSAMLCGSIALLAACQQRPAAPVPAPPQQVETGSRFHLRTPLTFPAGSSELLFQNEQLVPAGKLSRDMPFCKLVPESGAPRTIPAGNFTVGSVSYDEREIGTTTALVKVTRIALATAPKQPGYALSCGWPEGAPVQGFVTTQQIYNAIGGQFSMDLLR